jgi:hypothetical protein
VHIFREREGTAFIIRREEAEAAGLPHQFASRMITLTVHSSLEAIGFLAAVTGRLAEAGIKRECRVGLLSRSFIRACAQSRRSAASPTKHVEASAALVARMSAAISGNSRCEKIRGCSGSEATCLPRTRVLPRTHLLPFIKIKTMQWHRH